MTTGTQPQAPPLGLPPLGGGQPIPAPKQPQGLGFFQNITQMVPELGKTWNKVENEAVRLQKKLGVLDPKQADAALKQNKKEIKQYELTKSENRQKFQTINQIKRIPDKAKQFRKEKKQALSGIISEIDADPGLTLQDKEELKARFNQSFAQKEQEINQLGQQRIEELTTKVPKGAINVFDLERARSQTEGEARGDPGGIFVKSTLASGTKENIDILGQVAKSLKDTVTGGAGMLGIAATYPAMALEIPTRSGLRAYSELSKGRPIEEAAKKAFGSDVIKDALKQREKAQKEISKGVDKANKIIDEGTDKIATSIVGKTEGLSLAKAGQTGTGLRGQQITKALAETVPYIVGSELAIPKAAGKFAEAWVKKAVGEKAATFAAPAARELFEGFFVNPVISGARTTNRLMAGEIKEEDYISELIKEIGIDALTDVPGGAIIGGLGGAAGKATTKLIRKAKLEGLKAQKAAGAALPAEQKQAYRAARKDIRQLEEQRGAVARAAEVALKDKKLKSADKKLIKAQQKQRLAEIDDQISARKREVRGMSIKTQAAEVPPAAPEAPRVEGPAAKPRVERPELAAQTQNRYRQATTRATDIGKRTREIGKEIKKAESAGDAGLSAELKAERKALTQEKKLLKREIADIEKEGLELRKEPPPLVEPLPKKEIIPERLMEQLPPETKAAIADMPQSEALRTVRRILGEEEVAKAVQTPGQVPPAQKTSIPAQKLQPSPEQSLKAQTEELVPPSIRKKDDLQMLSPAKSSSAGQDLISSKIPSDTPKASKDIIPKKARISQEGLPEIKDPETGRVSINPDPRSYSLTKPPEVKSWKEFQEVLRNPKNFKTIQQQAAEAGRRVPANAQAQVDTLAAVKKQLNDWKATNEDLVNQIYRQAKAEGKTRVGVTMRDGTRKVFDITEQKRNPLTKEGRLLETKFKERALAEGKIALKSGADSLNVQPAAKGVSKAPGYGVSTLEGKVRSRFEVTEKIKELEKQEELLKTTLKGEVLSQFDHGGLRHIFRNTEGDTVFHVSKGKTDFDTKNIKKEVEAYRAELKAQGYTEARIARVINDVTEKIDEAQTRKVFETGQIKHPDEIKSLINTAKLDLEKANKGQALQFGFNPIAAVMAMKFITDPDAWVVGLRTFNPLKKFIDKIDSPLLNEVTNVVDGLTGRLKSYSLRLEESKSPVLQKLGKEYDELAGRELFAEGYLRTTLGKEQTEKIAEALKEETVASMLKKIERGDVIEGIESVEELELIKAFLNSKQKRADLIQDALNAAQTDPKITAQEKNLLKRFLDHETMRVKNGAIVSFLQDWAYGTALMNRMPTTGLAATDPFFKLIPEFGVVNLFQGIVKMADIKKSRSSSLFKAFNAGDSGTLHDAIRGSRRPGKIVQKLGKAGETFKKGDKFRFVTELSQDIALFTHAKAFNKHWKETTGKSVDIINDFGKDLDASLEFSMLHNDVLNRWYGTGKGVIHKNMLEASPPVKPLLAFLSEPMRFQMNMSRWGSRIKRGLAKDATAAEKMQGKAATKAMVNFVITGTALGGAGFVKNLGGSVGSAYNLALNNLSPKDQQRVEDVLNSVQLARRLNIELGEKLGVDVLQRGEGENFAERIGNLLKGENRNLLVDYIKRYPKTFIKARREWEAGNPTAATFTMAKGLLPSISGISSTVEKAIKKYNEEPISVWLNQGGKLTEIPKKVDWADIFSYSGTAADKRKSVEKTDVAVEEVADNYTFERGKAIPNNPEAQKRLSEYVDLLHQDRYQLAIDKRDAKTKTEIKQEIFEKAERKQKAKARGIALKGKALSPERILAEPESKSLPRLRLLFAKDRAGTMRALREAQMLAREQRDRAGFRKLKMLEMKLGTGFKQRTRERFKEQEAQRPGAIAL